MMTGKVLIGSYFFAQCAGSPCLLASTFEPNLDLIFREYISGGEMEG